MVRLRMERDKPLAAPVRPKTASRPPAPVRRERSRGGEARGIADLIPAIGETSFRRFGFIQSSLVSRWAEIAGPRYAAMASPESIAFPRGKKAEGTLQLVVTSATAIFMQHAEPEIIARVNRFFGYCAIVRVKYRHGALVRPKISGPRSLSPRSLPPPSLKPISIAPADGLRPITDPELQTVLESLARSMAEKEAREAAGDAAPVHLKSDNLKPVNLFARTLSPCSPEEAPS